MLSGFKTFQQKTKKKKPKQKKEHLEVYRLVHEELRNTNVNKYSIAYESDPHIVNTLLLTAGWDTDCSRKPFKIFNNNNIKSFCPRFIRIQHKQGPKDAFNAGVNGNVWQFTDHKVMKQHLLALLNIYKLNNTLHISAGQKKERKHPMEKVWTYESG